MVPARNLIFTGIIKSLSMRSTHTRRKFIQQSGILLSSALLPWPGFSMAGGRKYKMGLQLFTIRDAMERDPVGSLKRVKSLGYQDLETYGYDGEKGAYYGLKTAEFKQVLEELELTTSSGHYGFAPYFHTPLAQLEQFVDQCIEGALAAGQRYITWPWLDPESRSIASFKKLCEKLNWIGERVTQAGLGFAYHNHDYEFFDQGGDTGYDIILRETDPRLVKLQLDLYWVMHSSKKSPKELVALQPGRFVMWHIKDMDKVTRDYTELGNGSIDYTSILPDPELAGLEYYFIEQGGNFAENSMKSIAESAAYFQKNLQKHL